MCPNFPDFTASNWYFEAQIIQVERNYKIASTISKTCSSPIYNWKLFDEN